MKFVITITPAVRDKGAGKMWNYRPPGFLLHALGGCGRVLVYDYDCDASSADAKDASHTHTHTHAQQILICDRQVLLNHSYSSILEAAILTHHKLP